MKLWQKDKIARREVDKFTTGEDRQMDLFLAPFDVIGSLAHIRMLQSIDLLTVEEHDTLAAELKSIYQIVIKNEFNLPAEAEDIHSYVEAELTRRLGDTGKKIHSGRSRNDQVLVDIRLFLRHEIETITHATQRLFDLLTRLSDTHKDDLLPGYTHLQLAMPSSFGLWFGAYAESLVDDLITLEAAYRVVNKNPLGSAAGYGSSFPLNRRMTTQLLGFDDLNYNVVYAQMGRGKSERILASALSNIAATLAKLSMDACLFLNQNFGFISFPEDLTTGSSIMPHKKNPDVFELVRARCNQLISMPSTIAMVTANLPSGYHRDLQLLKTQLFPALGDMKECLDMVHLMLSHVEVRKDILNDEKYKYLFSVEEVNRLVQGGTPFRDAYRQVGLDIEAGSFNPERTVRHVHEGSMGNLNLPEIRASMDKVLASFDFGKARIAIERLLA